ncbi:MAG: hypothetical protein HXX17_09270 [Geobacteraceae bacterium]|nr:hypothetical protein [Geobacteraceae bacterium]
MKREINRYVLEFASNKKYQASILIVIIITMGSLNAIVDSLLHPDIALFDYEHIIVGGVTALVSTGIYLLSILYIRRLNEAKLTINALEKLLPICSYCRKIRKSDADPEEMASWQTIESYITEKTSSHFSHGICPECMVENFPEIFDHKAKKQSQ